MQKAKESMVRVIRPEYDRRRPIHTNDYVEVPRLATIGTWTILDMLNNPSVLNLITIYNGLKGSAKIVPISKART